MTDEQIRAEIEKFTHKDGVVHHVSGNSMQCVSLGDICCNIGCMVDANSWVGQGHGTIEEYYALEYDLSKEVALRAYQFGKDGLAFFNACGLDEEVASYMQIFL